MHQSRRNNQASVEVFPFQRQGKTHHFLVLSTGSGESADGGTHLAVQTDKQTFDLKLIIEREIDREAP